MLTPIDHILIIIFAGCFPIYGIFTYRKMIRRIKEGGRRARRLTYWSTMAWLWGFTLAILGVWTANDRPLQDLGFRQYGGVGFWVSLIAVAALLGWLAVQWTSVARNEDVRNQFRTAAKDIEPLLPHSRSEFGDFLGLSLTAGVCEEVMFRGYLIWYLGNFVSLGAAVFISSALFGYGHIYQGPSGVIKTGVVGLLAAGLFVLSGSLWIPIVLHAGIDILQGGAAYTAFREQSTNHDARRVPE